MNMQMTTMKVEDEVFSLASELVRRFSHTDTHECNFAFERTEFMSDDDFTYTLPETPFYLERHGLATILSGDVPFGAFDYWDRKKLEDKGINPEIGAERQLYLQNSLRLNKTNVSGFYAVSFKIDALKGWLEDELKLKMGAAKHLETKVPPGWKWLDEAEGIYQFGELGRFHQGRGEISKIFHEAMNLFHETPQAISAATLSEKTGVKDRPLLRRRLLENNEKLKKFGIKFVGSGEGHYRIESTANF
jgi:hypothetical protein